MKMRVALIGIYHESNTFAVKPTLYEDFEKSHLLIGSEIVDEYKNAFHEIGGMIEGINHQDIELVPVYFAEATPGGTITATTYQRLQSELLGELKKAMPLDGVLVVPHGAGVSENYLDMDGDWLSKVRETVGISIPIIGTLDPHANVSQLMIDSTDGLIAYSTNPHIDQRETGKKAGELMKRVLTENLELRQLLVELPLAISIEQQYTKNEPCKSLYDFAAILKEESDLISLSIALGFPYADVKEMGTSLVIITNKDLKDAMEAGSLIKEYVINNKESFVGQKNDINEILKGVKDYQKPILMLDMGDNIGGGSLGNSTYLLDALEKWGTSNSCICICNHEAVLFASKFDIGDTFSISLKDLNENNRDKLYQVTLINKQDGRFQELNPRHGGQVNFDMGKVVVLKTELGNTILISSLRVPPFSSQQLSAFGIQPETYDCIIAKGVNAPIAAYEEICKTILQIDSPGETQADITRFNYINRRKPLYPFEYDNQ